jgi:hypothetical protein
MARIAVEWVGDLAVEQADGVDIFVEGGVLAEQPAAVR